MPNEYAYLKLRETDVVREGTRKSMQGNRGTGTRPEFRLRQALWAAGLRGYRKNVRKLPGKPDVVFGKAKLAVFLHGCFWHGCPVCTRNRTPKTNARYWSTKVAANRERDERVRAELEAMGYRVVTIWECQLKASTEVCVERVREALTTSRQGVR